MVERFGSVLGASDLVKKGESALDSLVTRDSIVFSMSDDRLLNIGSFAMLSGLSIAALRHYDEVGVLEPAEVDPQTGYRRYHPDQVAVARVVYALRAVELPVAEIRRYLKAQEPEHARAILVKHKERLSMRARDMSFMVKTMDEYVEKGVVVPQVTGCRVVAINVGVKNLDESIKFYEEAFEVAFKSNPEDPKGAQLMFGTWPGEQFFLLNIRERDPSEPHHDHTSAFGLLVEDLGVVHQRALEAGAKEHFPPMETPGLPRHSRIEDPSGNRIVLWQG